MSPGSSRRSSALYMLYDLSRVDTTYDNELLTSSREGEIELTAGTARDLREAAMAMTTASPQPGSTSQRLSCCACSGRRHVWALGVGIVLVGEYMGWNFSVGKGGALAGADRLLGGRPALHLRRHDRFGGDLDRRRRRRPIRPGQAHRRAADGLQCRPVPGLRLHDARGRQRHHRRLSCSTRSAGMQGHAGARPAALHRPRRSWSWPGSTIAACWRR